MAAIVIEQYLPKTATYINDKKISQERAGHHNYCVTQKICNSSPCLAKMNETQLSNFDIEMTEYLTRLDIRV
jgi:hypothetical protein